MLRVAHGSATWLLTPLALAIIMAGLATPLGIPELMPLSLVPFFLFMSFWFFFRDPERQVGNHMVSAADGRVVGITEQVDPDIGPSERLSIFMRPQDVHVNRFPLEGDVKRVQHSPGKHVPAFNKDSDRNERVTLLMHTEIGPVKVVQIAGAVARRILPYSGPGDHVKKGERLGLIKLGSRCDLYVPKGSVEWLAEPKMLVRAGISSVAKIKSATWATTSAKDLPGGAQRTVVTAGQEDLHA